MVNRIDGGSGSGSSSSEIDQLDKATLEEYTGTLEADRTAGGADTVSDTGTETETDTEAEADTGVEDTGIETDTGTEADTAVLVAGQY